MIRKQLYITPEIDRELTILARREGKTVAHVYREILEKELKIIKGNEHPAAFLFRITGIGHKGPKDLSTNLTRYLYGDLSPNYGKRKKTSRRR